MKPVIRKGMVLCAGLGTRLHPITQSIPKPLVPVLNIPNVVHSLLLLKRAGITEIILNLHHLADKIESTLGKGEKYGLHLEYSREQVLLGTGGGVKKAESFFEGEPFVLVNCDFISDVDLIPHIIRHVQRKALGTMVLLDDPKRKTQYAAVGVDAAENLCSLPRYEREKPVRTGIFTGIHILDSSTLGYLVEKPSGINEILYPALMKELPKRVFCDFMGAENVWYDTGEISSLWACSLALLDKMPAPVASTLSEAGQLKQSGGVWVSPQTQIPKNVAVQSPALLGNCSFGDEKLSIGPRAVIGDGTRVLANIQQSLVFGNTVLERDLRTAIAFESHVLKVNP